MLQQSGSSPVVMATSPQLPASWQQVLAEGIVSDRDRYAQLAAQFLATPKLYDEQFSLRAVSAYGKSFWASAYPDFQQLKAKPHPQAAAAQRLVSGVENLFDDLRFEVSSWLYWALLHPLEREDMFQPASLRSLSDRDLACALDAANHGLNVSMMRRRVDSATSQFGLFVEHGCGCDKHAVRVNAVEETVQCQGIPKLTLSEENLSIAYGSASIHYQHSCRRE